MWEGRYRATLIDSEQYLLTCMRYIEMNPVRARMVSHPSEYQWSSYQFNALGKANLLVTPHDEYYTLGKTKERRQHYYRHLCDCVLPARDVEHIRQQTNKGWLLGSKLFKEKIAKKVNRPIEAKERGGDRKSQKYKEINRV